MVLKTHHLLLNNNYFLFPALPGVSVWLLRNGSESAQATSSTQSRVRKMRVWPNQTIHEGHSGKRVLSWKEEVSITVLKGDRF